MKILLVGEYSRLHNSLKEGLETLGHEVTIIATGDYFKDYPADIKLEHRYSSGISKKIKVALFRLFKIDIGALSLKRQFFKHSEKLRGYDIVQLINESPLGATPKVEMEIVSFLRKNNKKLFLLSCGTDYISVKYAFDKKFRYSILSPLFEGKVSEKDFAPALKYLRPDYKALHDYIYQTVDGVIASDLDYHIPLERNPKYLGLVPNPVNTEALKFEPLKISEKLVIFHGINRANFLKKGNDYFEAALKKIQIKYANKVEIITVENVPYVEYIKKYNQAHVLLDQVLSYDQGYNALEAMAKGKVVFTGAEKEFKDYYSLEEPVAINALPDAEYLFNKLEELILQPEKVKTISVNARKFIEKEHHYILAAKKYLEYWTDS